MWIYKYLTAFTVSLGKKGKEFISALTFLPRAFVEGVKNVATFGIGIGVLILLVVLWRRVKR